MQIFLRYAALVLAVITYAFAAASLCVAVVVAEDRLSMLAGTAILVVIGTFFVWRYREIRRQG